MPCVAACRFGFCEMDYRHEEKSIPKVGMLTVETLFSITG